MTIVDYFDGLAGRDCAYGTLDCATLMADWIMACGWPDPMSDRRGGYCDERSYRMAVRGEGGLVASCRRRFAAAGLRETALPCEGDVALVLAPYGWRRGRPLCRPVGSVMQSGTLAGLLSWPRGIVCAELPVLAAWSVARG